MGVSDWNPQWLLRLQLHNNLHSFKIPRHLILCRLECCLFLNLTILETNPVEINVKIVGSRQEYSVPNLSSTSPRLETVQNGKQSETENKHSSWKRLKRAASCNDVVRIISLCNKYQSY